MSEIEAIKYTCLCGESYIIMSNVCIKDIVCECSICGNKIFSNPITINADVEESNYLNDTRKAQTALGISIKLIKDEMQHIESCVMYMKGKSLSRESAKKRNEAAILFAEAEIKRLVNIYDKIIREKNYNTN